MNLAAVCRPRSGGDLSQRGTEADPRLSPLSQTERSPAQPEWGAQGFLRSSEWSGPRSRGD